MTKKELIESLKNLKSGYIASMNTLDTMKGWGKTQLEALYAMRIGVFKIQILELQIELKSLKKKIQLCHQYINRDENPPFCEIKKKVASMVKNAYEEIHFEKEKVAFGKQILSNLCSPEDTFEIKKIFRNVAKTLHPDINPELTEEQQNIWHLFYSAYKNSDLDKLKALQIVYTDDLKKMESQDEDLSEEDILLQTAMLKQGILELEEQIRQLENEFPFNIAEQIRDEQWVEEQQSIQKKEIVELELAVKEKRDIYQLLKESYE